MKIIELCAVLLFSILLVGCTASSPRLMDDPATVQQDYRLGAGDTVNIAVHGQPDMTMRFILDKSGKLISRLLVLLNYKIKPLIK